MTRCLLFRSLSFEEGTCTYLPGFTCEQRSSSGGDTTWVAIFDKGPEFVGANNVTKPCVVDTEDVSWTPVGLIKALPPGWSPSGDTEALCSSAATAMVGKPHSCFLIGGPTLTNENLCDSKPRLDPAELMKKNEISVYSLVPLPVVPLILALVWCIIERCSMLPSGGDRAEDTTTYAAMKPMVAAQDESRSLEGGENEGLMGKESSNLSRLSSEPTSLQQEKTGDGSSTKKGFDILLCCGRRGPPPKVIRTM